MSLLKIKNFAFLEYWAEVNGINQLLSYSYIHSIYFSYSKKYPLKICRSRMLTLFLQTFSMQGKQKTE